MAVLGRLAGGILMGAAKPERILARLRRLCLALPDASETRTFGHPTFRAGKKTFAVFEKYRGEDTLCFKASLSDQALLVLDPRFFVAPYVGQHGWTSMRFSPGVDWEEVEDVVRESYRLVATKKMLASLAPPRRGRKTRKK